MATYVVGSWSDFLDINKEASVSSGDTIYFADSNLDGSGNFVGSGTGTRDNPYICGTYNEMLAATGATNIYYLELVKDGDDSHGYHLYHYDGKYARHDRSTTTINFNDYEEYLSGFDDFDVYCNINFNGWTLLNLKFKPSKCFRWKRASSSNVIKQLILLNCQFSHTGSNLFYCFGSDISNAATLLNDCVIHIDVQVSYNYYQAALVRGTATSNIYRCSFTVTGNCCYWCFGHVSDSSYAIKYYDSTFDLDLNFWTIATADKETKSYFYSCLFKGKMHWLHSANDNERKLGILASLCIIDCTMVSSTENLELFGFYNVGTITLYNNQKCGGVLGATSNLVAVTTAQLKEPTTLQSKGFPIGADA